MLRELSEETGQLPAYSRRIVGWACDRAVYDRRPSPGLVHHSDPGSSYAATESFFATLKNEVIHRCGPYTREDLIRDLVVDLEGFYNRRRGEAAPRHAPASLRACPRAMSVAG